MQARAAGGHAMGAARDLRGAARPAAYAAGQAGAVAHVAAHELGAAAYAIKAARAAAPEGHREPPSSCVGTRETRSRLRSGMWLWRVQVQIRYMPHDDRSIEFYDGETHLCAAYPTGQLTAAQTDAFRERARAEATRLGRERRRASRQARRTLAPMTGNGTPPAEPRPVPEGDGRTRTQRERDRRSPPGPARACSDLSAPPPTRSQRRDRRRPRPGQHRQDLRRRGRPRSPRLGPPRARRPVRPASCGTPALHPEPAQRRPHQQMDWLHPADHDRSWRTPTGPWIATSSPTSPPWCFSTRTTSEASPRTTGTHRSGPPPSRGDLVLPQLPAVGLARRPPGARGAVRDPYGAPRETSRSGAGPTVVHEVQEGWNVEVPLKCPWPGPYRISWWQRCHQRCRHPEWAGSSQSSGMYRRGEPEAVHAPARLTFLLPADSVRMT